MTRDEAVRWWREIRDGGGVDQEKYRDAVPPGNVAAYLWGEGAFTLGVEYGVLMALHEVFGITDAAKQGEPGPEIKP